MPKWAKILIGLVAIAIVIVIGFLVYLNTAFISKEEVEENLAKHINIDSSELYFEKIDLELENNQYEVDFYYNNNEYEAKIDAKEGKIIYTDFPMTNTTNNTTNNPTNNATNNTTNSTTNNGTTETTKEISLEEAKTVALKHANLNEANLTLIKAKEENDDGKMVYEIEWHDGTYEYDFDISKTGEVLHYDKDRIHD